MVHVGTVEVEVEVVVVVVTMETDKDEVIPKRTNPAQEPNRTELSSFF